ncbi:Uncharacterised protein [Bordetella pertussis]|nr:Uncharacterised protein [Bordetella pertussis]
MARRSVADWNSRLHAMAASRWRDAGSDCRRSPWG